MTRDFISEENRFHEREGERRRRRNQVNQNFDALVFYCVHFTLFCVSLAGEESLHTLEGA